ncbi:MAG: tyrosine-type recombinase/integrase [Myxococcota bacterium]
MGWFPEGGEAVLREAAGALVHEFRQSAPSEAPGIPKTVGELLDRYIDQRRQDIWEGDPRERPNAEGLISPSSFEKYEYAVGHLKAWLTEVLLSQVDEAVVRQYAVNRRHKDKTPSKSDRTVHFEVNVLVFAGAWGKRFGWVAWQWHNPVHVDHDRWVNNHYTPLPHEARAVLERLPAEIGLAAELIAWTGARRGEVLRQLLVRDADPQAGFYHLFGKGRKWRDMPIHPRHMPWVVERKKAENQDEPLILAPPEHLRMRRGAYKGLHESTVQRHLDLACKAAGTPLFTPHALRRMAEDLLHDARVDPGTAGKILGHSPEVALKSYRTVRASAKRAAMFNAGLAAALPGVGGNVLQFAGPGAAPQVDLTGASMEELLAEVDRRGRMGHDRSGEVRGAAAARDAAK